MSEEINENRRRFLAGASLTFAAAHFGVNLFAVTTRDSYTATTTSIESLKQIDAGVLNVGFAEAGKPDGLPVLLLHGWPYNIHSYVDVASVLASKGYRV